MEIEMYSLTSKVFAADVTALDNVNVELLVKAAFPLSERKVGCKIITLQDFRVSRIDDFNRKSLSNI